MILINNRVIMGRNVYLSVSLRGITFVNDRLTRQQKRGLK